ncbi:MAG: type IV secretion system DNA-binding domain-containing protein [Solirubrobacterales bacterium]|nr:type IV secretion system DNA-binding domain-containing protein [Solirubrobacterales bacterium]
MRPPSPRPLAPLWQRLLAFAVAATVLVASPPLWATVLLTSAAMGVIFAGPAIAARRRRARASAVEPGAATVLGTDQDGAPVALTDGQLEAHTVIVGASGSGKSTTMLRILADQIVGGKGVVAIDMKGSPAFAAQLAHAARQAGKPFYLWSPDGPAVWNPLAYGNPTELKDKIMSMERFTEIHYQRAAERYLQTVLQALERARSPDRAPTLGDVVELLDPARLEGFLRATPPEFADRVQRYLGELTLDQLSAIRGLGTRLAIITEAHTGQYLGAPVLEGRAQAVSSQPASELDLRAALRGEQIVLFSLNSSSYGKLAAQLEALVLRDLITAVGERTADPARRHPAMVALDEFSASEDDQVLGLQARCRESCIGFAVASQEPTDFDRVARGLLNQVIGNTAVKISHRLDVPSSAQLIADIAGTETVWEETHQVQRHPLFGARISGRSTARQVERYIVHPNVIKSLPTGRAVVITKIPQTRVRIVDIDPPAAPGDPTPGHSPGGLAPGPRIGLSGQTRSLSPRRSGQQRHRASPQPPGLGSQRPSRLPASGRDGPGLG